MANFEYEAIDQSGRPSAGVVDAPSSQSAIGQLAARGIFATKVEQAAAGDDVASTANLWGWWHGRRRISAAARAALWRQIATALEAGLPLLSALQVVGEQAERQAVRELLEELSHAVRGGQSLSLAMAEHPALFTPMQISMVRAGETAGVLDQVTTSLAEFAQRDLEIRQRIASASTYPIIVLSLALVSMVVILAFILPRIIGAIAENAPVLPLPTRLLMGMSDALRWWGWLMALLLGLSVWAFRRWVSKPAGRLAFDRFKLRVPVLGPTLRTIAVARFARALGTLSQSGIQILEALTVLRDTLGNEAMAQRVDEVRQAITQGQSIAEPLREAQIFPPLFIQVVALGERTGKLDEMLLRAADSYDKDTATAIERTMTLLPAAFIVILAVVVGFILAAVLLPIVNLQVGL
jgi:type II secretory pathway component PulF